VSFSTNSKTLAYQNLTLADQLSHLKSLFKLIVNDSQEEYKIL